MEIKTDFLVIGSGASGLFSALKMAPYGKVLVITKKSLEESCSFYAQGGIAAVSSQKDSFEDHIKDTLDVGAGLSRRDVVEMIVKSGPEIIKELKHMGVNFSLYEKDCREYDLTKEGGHSKRRVVHIGDTIGEEIIRVLAANVKKTRNIKIMEDIIVVNLITLPKRKGGGKICWGAYVLDKKRRKINSILARATVLATGGCGKVYLYTSNPDVATGDGVAMAYRAGCRIANMEFLQFHPTCLYHPQAKNFLISESLRGEGAILKLVNGRRFMRKYHPKEELAPRDIVARAIDQEMKEKGHEYVLLDISHKDSDFVKKRFPNIYKTCMSYGFDLTKEPVPVVPAAHYSCGGAITDKSGKTNIKRLYAIGEVACTGLHGANRLASNSLLETMVMAERVAHDVLQSYPGGDVTFPHVAPWNIGKAVDSNEEVIVSHNWDEIRRLMWNYVGIVRSNKRLARAKRRIELLQREIHQYYWDFILTSDLIELRNIAAVAEIIIKSALKRKESRGLHYNLDYPHRNNKEWKRDTIILNR